MRFLLSEDGWTVLNVWVSVMLHPPVLGISVLSVARGQSSSQHNLVIALRLKRNESQMAPGLDSDYRIRVLVRRKRLVQRLQGGLSVRSLDLESSWGDQIEGSDGLRGCS
ncbi:hypothetical protein BDR22DRAFT_844020 [Usnea florida]